jgi:ribose transport system ATP-binding protein
MNDQLSATVEDDVLLRSTGICKSFPGVQALNDVQITVRRGRLNALVGENGAGKTTLMNILSGVFPPDKGEIRIGGRPIRFRDPAQAQQAGIATIYQELNLVLDLSVAENIFLGREPRNRLGLLDYRKMHEQARQLLGTLGVDVDPRTPVARLRVGVQQVVEIAKAMSLDARVIIMDEPTSALSEQETESLFRLIRQLKERGVGIIYITHKLDELGQIADELTVFRDGRFIAERPFREVTHDDIVRMMVGRELAQVTSTPEARGAEVLQVRCLSLVDPGRAGDYAVRDISFTVRRGEIVGLFGLMGAGRTELLQSVFGLHPGTSSGQIVVDGKPVTIRSPGDAIRAGIALAPEDRKAEGLVLPMSVGENVSLPSLERTTWLGILRPALERRLVQSFIDRLRVKTSSLNQRVINLSGGNQQKVVVSKWLAVGPKVLLLDEPTRGIDVGAKFEIYSIIAKLAEEGRCIVLVSSELPEILALADRILVMAEGRVTAEISREEATEENVLRAALPRGKSQKARSA